MGRKILAWLWLLLLPVLAIADTQVIIDWTHSPDPAAVGYKLYQRQGNSFTQIVNVGYVTHYVLLTDGAQYDYGFTAYNEAGVQGWFSDFQTFPLYADELERATDVNIRYEQEGQAMAVDYVASPFTANASGNVNTSTVTIPEGATLGVIRVSGWAGGADYCVASCSLDSVSGVLAVRTTPSGENMQTEFYVVELGSGNEGANKNLTITMDGSPGDGFCVAVVFFSGQDPDTPVGNTGTDVTDPVSIQVDTVAGDMVVFGVSGYNASSITTGTVVVQQDYNNDVSKISYLLADAASETMTGGGNYPGAAAFVIKQAAGGEELTLTAEPATVTISGQDTGLKASRLLSAAVGEITISGQDTGLQIVRTLIGEPGTITIGGQDTSLLLSKLLSCEVGVVTVSGQDTGLLAQKLLTAESGAITVSGQDTALYAHRVLTAETGQIIISGEEVDFTPSGLLILVCEPGTITIGGMEAGLLANRLLGAEAGTLTASGTDTSLLAQRVITAEAGRLIIGGHEASLLYHRILQAETGSFIISGEDTALQRILQLLAGEGAVTLAGGDAVITWEHLLDAETGTITINGQTVNLIYSGAVAPVAPTARTIIIAAENRTIIIPAESRIMIVAAQNRTMTVVH